MSEISEPAMEWTYRNIQCRLYRLDDIKVLGYVRIGDEWAQVIETERMTTDVKNDVERAVDNIIMDAVNDEPKHKIPWDDIPEPDDDYPNPLDPDPLPDPNIDPYEPYPWETDDEIPWWDKYRF